MTQPQPTKMTGEAPKSFTVVHPDTPLQHTVLYQSPPKKGKTHCICSWPGLSLFYTDPNLATPLKLGVSPILVDNVNQWDREILPAIKNREFQCESIGLDSLSFLADLKLRQLKGARDKLEIAQWGTFLDSLDRWVNDLIRCALPFSQDPSKPTYNILMSVHEVDVTGDDGALLRTVPAIAGQFKDRVARYFNTVLLNEVQVKNVTVGTAVTRTPEYFCYAVPPDRFRTCGDGVGGGKYNKLPPRVDGTYSGLMKAWGILTTQESV